MNNLKNENFVSLKAVAMQDVAAAGYIATSDDAALSVWLNEVDVTYFVWRTNLTIAECNGVIVWTEVDALTPGKARIWEWMSKMSNIDASQINVRQGISDAFSSAQNTRNALTALAKRNATRAERILSTGTGSNASPSVMSYEGRLTPTEASLVRVA